MSDKVTVTLDMDHYDVEGGIAVNDWLYAVDPDGNFRGVGWVTSIQGGDSGDLAAIWVVMGHWLINPDRVEGTYKQGVEDGACWPMDFYTTEAAAHERVKELNTESVQCGLGKEYWRVTLHSDLLAAAPLPTEAGEPLGTIRCPRCAERFMSLTELQQHLAGQHLATKA